MRTSTTFRTDFSVINTGTSFVRSLTASPAAWAGQNGDNAAGTSASTIPVRQVMQLWAEKHTMISLTPVLLWQLATPIASLVLHGQWRQLAAPSVDNFENKLEMRLGEESKGVLRHLLSDMCSVPTWRSGDVDDYTE